MYPLANVIYNIFGWSWTLFWFFKCANDIFNQLFWKMFLFLFLALKKTGFFILSKSKTFSFFKRWVKAYCTNRLLVNCNTSNGVEGQNNTLKHSYLQQHKTNSLMGILTVVVEDFLQDKYERQYCFIFVWFIYPLAVFV